MRGELFCVKKFPPHFLQKTPYCLFGGFRWQRKPISKQNVEVFREQ